MTEHDHNYYKRKYFSCTTAILEMYLCNKCDFETDLRILLRQHLGICGHKEDKIPLPEFLVSHKCEFCDFKTYSEFLSLRHEARMHFKPENTTAQTEVHKFDENESFKTENIIGELELQKIYANECLLETRDHENVTTSRSCEINKCKTKLRKSPRNKVNAFFKGPNSIKCHLVNETMDKREEKASEILKRRKVCQFSIGEQGGEMDREERSFPHVTAEHEVINTKMDAICKISNVCTVREDEDVIAINSKRKEKNTFKNRPSKRARCETGDGQNKFKETTSSEHKVDTHKTMFICFKCGYTGFGNLQLHFLEGGCSKFKKVATNCSEKYVDADVGNVGTNCSEAAIETYSCNNQNITSKKGTKAWNMLSKVPHKVITKRRKRRRRLTKKGKSLLKTKESYKIHKEVSNHTDVLQEKHSRWLSSKNPHEMQPDSSHKKMRVISDCLLYTEPIRDVICEEIRVVINDGKTLNGVEDISDTRETVDDEDVVDLTSDCSPKSSDIENLSPKNQEEMQPDNCHKKIRVISDYLLYGEPEPPRDVICGQRVVSNNGKTVNSDEDLSETRETVDDEDVVNLTSEKAFDIESLSPINQDEIQPVSSHKKIHVISDYLLYSEPPRDVICGERVVSNGKTLNSDEDLSDTSDNQKSFDIESLPIEMINDQNFGGNTLKITRNLCDTGHTSNEKKDIHENSDVGKPNMTGPVILCRTTLKSEYFVVNPTPATNLINTEIINNRNNLFTALNIFTANSSNGATNLKVAPNILVTNNQPVNFNQFNVSNNVTNSFTAPLDIFETISNKGEVSLPNSRNEATNLNNSVANEETDLNTSKEPPLTQEELQGPMIDEEIKLIDSKLSVEQKYQKVCHKCLHCLYESSDVSALLKHMRENHVMSDLIFTHWEKNADFEVTPEDVSDFIKSCRKVDSDIFKCAKCDFESKTQVATRNHYLENHFDRQIEYSPEDRWYTCVRCELKTKDVFSLRDHVRNVQIARRRFASSRDIEFGDLSLEKGVVLTPNEYIKLDKKLFKCKRCNFQHKSIREMENHFYVKYTSQDGDGNFLDEKVTCVQIQWHKCEQCPFKSRRIHILEKHVRQDHSGGKFIASKCLTRSQLISHLAEDEKYDKMIVSKDITHYHESCVKTYAGSFKCAICGDNIKSLAPMQSHFLSHYFGILTYRGKYYTCLRCSFKSVNIEDLISHLQDVIFARNKIHNTAENEEEAREEGTLTIDEEEEDTTDDVPG